MVLRPSGGWTLWQLSSGGSSHPTPAKIFLFFYSSSTLSLLTSDADQTITGRKEVMKVMIAGRCGEL